MSFHCSRSSGGVSSLFSCFINGAPFWPSPSSSESSSLHCFGTKAGGGGGDNDDTDDDALRTVSGDDDGDDDADDDGGCNIVKWALISGKLELIFDKVVVVIVEVVGITEIGAVADSTTIGESTPAHSVGCITSGSSSLLLIILPMRTSANRTLNASRRRALGGRYTRTALMTSTPFFLRTSKHTRAEHKITRRLFFVHPFTTHLLGREMHFSRTLTRAQTPH